MQKEKSKENLKYSQKTIKDRILITCSQATAPEKGAC
jgi:flagellar basal body-associated protein FliL